MGGSERTGGTAVKELKELAFEELTLKQKLGMVHAVYMHDSFSDENKEYILNMIRNRLLGAIWIQFNEEGAERCLQMVKQAADYPILIMTDAESGMGEYLIGHHNALGCTGDEKYAYAFGKATAVVAKRMGYNVVCNPVLDIKTDGWVRSYGSEKFKIAKMAAAEARGMHDGGVLTVGKHYPSGTNPLNIDSHMAEAYSDQTEAELIDYSLYAYIELIKQGLLDGLMTAHHRFRNIDPDAPASLSPKMLSIIRDKGFDGFLITDALCMMGIRARYGDIESKGLSIAVGNDLALPYDREVKWNQEALEACYQKGMITDERLNEAVKRVLAAQHKALMLEKSRKTELTEEEIDLVKRINKDSVYAKTDEGIPASISRDGKHFFALMTRNEETVQGGEVAVDTFSNGWLYPSRVTAKIKRLFPNSAVYAFHQFPRQTHNSHILSDSREYEDIIFITFSEALAYTGAEHLTRRVEMLIQALQYTDRVSTLIHFGNPCILENLPHIPRYILGGLSEESVNACLDVLAGEYEARGVPTYHFKLN